ncbi:Xylose isomerase domain protein TIM barrel [Geobacter metallireducens RCH3]|uniref:TIM barrel protein, AP endonuclease family 2/xylose isomerase-like family n=1 Tax=Geobacter metallireducens (strain ATCC 53774 / DSM 7210 / GS-15) TaxID=269799 RepID=Q39ZL1_GEOMG|nr:sugar phosphate isomerase/epimerase family protein [Geobacter metallireducens]ABB30313.1 TIM barrel protein, AP endonuclease family 2/xylose isomerase-like family [Geobacter metallireducens GS-15]EHP84906.1 Xylose isomerase domain protein TIM barrel [Geobacter metallireducens RCH3]
MSNCVYAHVPYSMLAANLPAIISRRINPEIFFSGDTLDTLVPEEVGAIAGQLAEAGLRCTFHGAFIDLNPGSVERLIREATMHRFGQVLDAAQILKPDVIVFHPGYDKWRYGESQDKWLAHSIVAWRQVLERTDSLGTTIAVENIFEEEPSTLKALFEAIDHPRLRHCFDVGHWNLFHTVGMEEWFAELGSFVAEAHIHDNFGKRDDHLPLGEAAIDFDLFFSLMERYAPGAAWTIEAHCRDALDRALVAIEKYRT